MRLADSPLNLLKDFFRIRRRMVVVLDSGKLGEGVWDRGRVLEVGIEGQRGEEIGVMEVRIRISVLKERERIRVWVWVWIWVRGRRKVMRNAGPWEEGVRRSRHH